MYMTLLNVVFYKLMDRMTSAILWTKQVRKDGLRDLNYQLKYHINESKLLCVPSRISCCHRTEIVESQTQNLL